MDNSKYTPEERERHIDRLYRSFVAMGTSDRIICMHAMRPPSLNPDTGRPWKNFREIIEPFSDSTIEELLSAFEGNGQLLGEDPSL